MNYMEESLKLHYEWKGKIGVESKVKVGDKTALSLAYTPGVAAPCLEIEKNTVKSFDLTARGNVVAVITNGTAVLGLGDIGPEASMPVMEGKCLLFKEFAGIDAIPICIKSKDVDEVVNTVSLISPSFGGINLEDIAAPECFEIEEKLKKVCDIPIFHDDQHGTAVVVLAALINSLKLVGKKLENCTVAISGAGSAGTAIADLLKVSGAEDIIVSDRKGIICKGTNLDSRYAHLTEFTNKNQVKGTLADSMKGADVFIGVSAGGIVSEEMVSSMAENAIILALANPIPEIIPELAKNAGAKIVCTGRSDFPNQVNNVLAFPGIFKGALSVRAKDINEEMKLAAAFAIASLVSEEELDKDYILPTPFDTRVADRVSKAVAQAAVKSNVAQIKWR